MHQRKRNTTLQPHTSSQYVVCDNFCGPEDWGFTHRELHTKNTSSTCLHLDRIQYKHFHMTLGDTYYNDTHMDPEWNILAHYQRIALVDSMPNSSWFTWNASRHFIDTQLLHEKNHKLWSCNRPYLSLFSVCELPLCTVFAHITGSSF